MSVPNLSCFREVRYQPNSQKRFQDCCRFAIESPPQTGISSIIFHFQHPWMKLGQRERILCKRPDTLKYFKEKHLFHAILSRYRIHFAESKSIRTLCRVEINSHFMQEFLQLFFIFSILRVKVLNNIKNVCTKPFLLLRSQSLA